MVTPPFARVQFPRLLGFAGAVKRDRRRRKVEIVLHTAAQLVPNRKFLRGGKRRSVDRFVLAIAGKGAAGKSVERRIEIARGNITGDSEPVAQQLLPHVR